MHGGGIMSHYVVLDLEMCSLHRERLSEASWRCRGILYAQAAPHGRYTDVPTRRRGSAGTQRDAGP